MCFQLMVLGQKGGLCHIPALGLTCLCKSSSQNTQRKGAARPFQQHVGGMIKNWDMPTPQQWLELVVRDEPVNRKESCWGSRESVVAAGQPRDGGLPQLLSPEETLSIFWILLLEAELGWDAAYPRAPGTTLIQSNPLQATPAFIL